MGDHAVRLALSTCGTGRAEPPQRHDQPPRARRFASRSRASVSPASAGGVSGRRCRRGRRRSRARGGRRRRGVGGSGGRGVGRFAGGAAGLAAPVAVRCGRGRRCADLALADAESPRRIAARADDPAARSRAASMPATSTGRGATDATPAPAAGHPAPRVGQLAPPDRDPPQGDVERPQQQRQDQQHRPEVGVGVGRLEVVGPRLGRQVDRPPAGRRAERREERLVRAEEPVLGGRRRDEAQRPPERRRAGPRLRDADDVRARRRSRRAAPRRRPARPGRARPPASSGRDP